MFALTLQHVRIDEPHDRSYLREKFQAGSVVLAPVLVTPSGYLHRVWVPAGL